MTAEEIREKAKYMQFPTKAQAYKEYPALRDKEVVRLPANGMIYKTWSLNEHHYTTQYHREILYPILADILNFQFSQSDYHLLERKCNNYDISMLVPNNSHTFEVECFERDETMSNISYEALISGKGGNTEYHNLYSYPHMCSRVTNNTINSNRRLFISGDSQMIPAIAFLAQNFKEVYYFDNRTGKSFKNKYENVEFTDVLFAFHENNERKYLNDNLR